MEWLHHHHHHHLSTQGANSFCTVSVWNGEKKEARVEFSEASNNNLFVSVSVAIGVGASCTIVINQARSREEDVFEFNNAIDRGRVCVLISVISIYPSTRCLLCLLKIFAQDVFEDRFHNSQVTVRIHLPVGDCNAARGSIIPYGS